MAQIAKYPFVCHFRAEANQHALRFRNGKLVAQGCGITFWFRTLNTAIAVVPSEDLEITFLANGRSQDFQEANVQGVVTCRVTDPVRLAQRVDFSVDLATGLHRHKPLERIANAVGNLAHQLATDLLVAADLATLMATECDRVRERMEQGLRDDHGIADLGIAVVAVRVNAISPSPEVGKALRVRVREAIQQEADEATFRRRAMAVEKERAIQENELQNKIELAKREAALLQQRGENERRRVTDDADAQRITAQGVAARHEIEAKAHAAATRMTEDAKVGAERDRMQIYREFPPEQLMALALQELAGKLNNVGAITITPDHAGALLKQLGLGAVPVLQPAKKEA